MNVKEALKTVINAANAVTTAYLEDLTDADMLVRPAPGCNHINWQVGHLIASEYHHTTLIDPALAKPLPPGFAEKYTSETARSDDPAQFCTKAELMQAAAEQRAATLAALQAFDESRLDEPTGAAYAPTKGDMFSMQGSHWLMHAGQWVVVRRLLGKPPLF